MEKKKTQLNLNFKKHALTMLLHFNEINSEL